MTIFTEEIEILAKDWFRRCRESQMAHYEYGSILEKRHLYFGIPAIVLSTIVGTTVFGAWEESAEQGWVRVVLGLLSILAACVTALQTFLNLSDRAIRHKSAGANYGAIRRELELLKTMPPQTDEEMRKSFEEIKRKMDELAGRSPSIPSAFKQRIDERLKSKDHERIYKLNSNTMQ